MEGGIDRLCDLSNVYWDASVVQESIVFKVFFDRVDPARVMYGTDLPIMAMRGRRICINGAWMDVTRETKPWTATRNPENPIRGTFMTYEMIRAMREGATAAGLGDADLALIFFENGMRLIEGARRNLERA